MERGGYHSLPRTFSLNRFPVTQRERSGLWNEKGIEPRWKQRVVKYRIGHTVGAIGEES